MKQTLNNYRAWIAKDSEEKILDIITTIIVGGAIIALLGLVILPAVFIPLSIIVGSAFALAVGIITFIQA